VIGCMDIRLFHAMDRSPPTIAANALVSEAIASFSQTEYPGFFVVSPPDFQLVGRLTHRELMPLIAAGTASADACVFSVMVSPVCLLKESDCQNIDAVWRLFDQYQLQVLPIVNDVGQLVGAITANGLLQALKSRESAWLPERGDRLETSPQPSNANSSLQRQLKQALLLQDLTQAIHAQRELENLLKVTTTQVGQLFGVPHCHLLVNIPVTATQRPVTTGDLTIEAAHSEISRQLGEMFLLAEVTHPQALQPNQAIAIANVYAEPCLQPIESLCQQIDLKSMLAIRTSYQGKVNGLLLVLECDRFRPWTTREIQLLEAIAAQVGIALAQIGLLEQEKQQRTALEQQNQQLQQEIQERQAALRSLQKAEEHLELFFTQSLDGFFFMMLDQPIEWNDRTNKDQALEYVFAHQRIPKVNDAMLDQYGTNREDFLGLTPNDLFAHDPLQGRQVWRQFFDQGKLHIETQEQKLDGSPIWIEGDYICLYDDQGRITGHFGVQRDVTDRKRAETALKRQQDFLRSVIDIPPNLIFAKDWNGRFVLANQATAEIYGTTVEHLIGKIDADFNPNLAEVEQFLQADREVIQTRQPKLLDETVTSAQGETRCFQTIKKPIEAIDGQSILVLGVATDISDRKQAEAALAKRERYLTALVEIQRLLLANKTNQADYTEILQQLGVASGASRVYLFENHQDAAGNLFMSQRAEWCAPGILPEIDNPLLQNLSYQEFFPRWATALSQGESINGVVADFPASEQLVLEPQGILAILILPLIVGSQFCGFIGFDNCVAAQAWDSLEVSLLSAAAGALSLHKERQQAEAAIAKLLVQTQEQSLALEKARDAAETASRAKSEFLANMSHEFRTPLNAILGFTQVLSRDPHLSGENQEYVNIINHSGQHLLELINDVLEMSKIEAGRLRLHLTNFDLYHMLDTLHEMLQLKARAKQLVFTVERHPDVPQYLSTDEGKLRQVLLNLLDNAIKFTHCGTVTLRVMMHPSHDHEISHKSLEPDQQNAFNPPLSSPSPPLLKTLWFEVEDTGCGIPPQNLPQLFTPFMQTRTGQQPSEGTGLGLAISQKFVQLMGGKITVESRVSQGSFFRFWIQAALAETAEPPQYLSAQRVIQLAPDQPDYRVLIVEDHWENQQVLIKLLKPLGFEVRVASNGQEGMLWWECWHPHAILLDMRMPIMDGYEVTQQIRAKEAHQSHTSNQERPTTKILAVTSSAFDEERSAILAIGCDDFIRKPFRQEEIFAKLAHHLGVRYLYDHAEQSPIRRAENTPAHNSYPAPLESGLVLDATAFNKLPTDWVNQLHQAAVLGKDRQMLQLIEQLSDTDLPLAQTLREWVHSFRFEEIIELTESIRNQ